MARRKETGTTKQSDRPEKPSDGKVYGGTVTSLKEKGQKVIHSPHHAPILLIYDSDRVYAVDNRCPHMGFPLERGSAEDGILTCHWHHARFCLSSGGTFDPFADDLRTYDVEVKGEDLWIHLGGSFDRESYWKQRLQDGLRHGLNLVIAKAVTALVDLDVPLRQIVSIGAEFGCTYRRSWSPGLTILSAMANVTPSLPRDERIYALYQAMVHVSRDTRGQTPRFSLGPLAGSETAKMNHRHETWFRHFVEVRDEDGAERTLLTAVDQGADEKQLLGMLIAAATDHVYLDVGHVVDFINKSCEMLDVIGWDKADLVLPTIVPLLCNAERSEELAAWRRPVDLISLLKEAEKRLQHIDRRQGRRADGWTGNEKDLSNTLLTEDPHIGLDALLTALERGATPDRLAHALALAAARRVLLFHTQNEFSDWNAVHHTFTYANALHQIIRRVPSKAACRGLLHGALRLFLDRFLNVPPAKVRQSLVEEESRGLLNGSVYDGRLMNLLDQAENVDRAAALTSAALEIINRHNGSGGDETEATELSLDHMWIALIRAVVREDANFHTLQMVEAAWRQFQLASIDNRPIPMIAATRYIAAHAPTHRELRQTVTVAMRLQAGESLHDDQ